ncbi:multiple antibiotic resistance protein MarA [Klebsiella pneumoniae]|nr:multiple antibiotic resistance protein MarA [Klebsiella pneumoniae]
MTPSLSIVFCRGSRITWNRPLSLEKVSERSGYSKWHLQRMFKKETGHSLGQYIRSRKLTEIAQKLKQSNEANPVPGRNAMVSSRSRP